MIVAYVVAALYVVGVAVLAWAAHQADKRHVTQHRAARLAAHAEYEHSLVMRRDPRGFWGQWPPERTHP